MENQSRASESRSAPHRNFVSGPVADFRLQTSSAVRPLVIGLVALLIWYYLTVN